MSWKTFIREAHKCCKREKCLARAVAKKLYASILMLSMLMFSPDVTIDIVVETFSNDTNDVRQLTIHRIWLVWKFPRDQEDFFDIGHFHFANWQRQSTSLLNKVNKLKFVKLCHIRNGISKNEILTTQNQRMLRADSLKPYVIYAINVESLTL